MKNAIISLSGELLSCGVFNHLPDTEISQLHRMIVLANLYGGNTPTLSLISYWYKGDYLSTPDAKRILQKSNEYLQSIGQPLIEICGQEEIFEMA